MIAINKHSAKPKIGALKRPTPHIQIVPKVHHYQGKRIKLSLNLVL